MTRDPWTDPDPQPGDFDADLAAIDPRDVESHVGVPSALGDLPRPEYIARRDAIHAELAALTPQPTLDLDRARTVLEDFAVFWQQEHDPSAKRQFLHLIFDGV